MSEQMKERLVAMLGPGAVGERPVADMWPLGLIRRRAGQAPPSVLTVRPVEVEQVVDLVRWAAGAGVSLVPFGGASGVCGAVSAAGGEVALDMGGFDSLLDIDSENLTCHVQAGMPGLRLEETLQDRGLTLGHYPSSLPIATVGGLIATRSSGQESSRWGSIEDMVLGLTAVLPDGSVARPRRGPRSAAGPALHELMIGSEGALGVIIDAVLRINRRPARVIGRGYRFASLEAGLEVMREVVQRGIRPLVMRLYDADDTAFQGVGGDGCLLMVAFAGEPGVAAAETRCFSGIVGGVATDLGEEPWQHWRRHRFDLSADRMRRLLEPDASFLDTIEVAAAWSDLPGLWRSIKAALVDCGALALCHFSHAYPQGCCAYFSFGGGAADEAAAEAAYSRAWTGAMAACAEHGATISHHHGVGRVRAGWIREEMAGWDRLWDGIRSAADPAGIMNPNAVGGAMSPGGEL